MLAVRLVGGAAKASGLIYVARTLLAAWFSFVGALGVPHAFADDARFFPSKVTVRGEVPSRSALVRQWRVERCVGCHEEVVRQWRGSAHAHSSFDNPWYRASVHSFRRTRGREKSRFCGGCHDPGLLFAGGMDEPIRPHDPLATAGVTCLLCHSVTQSLPDGNASYEVQFSEVPIPVEGDPASLQAHRERLRPSNLGHATFCGSCHRGFLSHDTGHEGFILGVDDFGAWQSSAFASSEVMFIDEAVEPETCQGCHMRSENGVASHRFAGGHTALSRFLRDPEQLASQRKMLESAATVRLAGVWSADGFSTVGGIQELHFQRPTTLDVVVRNVGAGHRFPGGVRDTQDTWLEVGVRDDGGVLLASSARPYRLSSTLLSKTGWPELEHRVERVAATGWDRTIAARDALLVQFALPALPNAKLPLTFELRLMHRSHTLRFHRAGCRTRGSRPCRGLPLTEIAAFSIHLPASDRLPNSLKADLAHLQASLHRRQEELSELTFLADARVSEARRFGDRRMLARARYLRAEVYRRTGQTEAALRAYPQGRVGGLAFAAVHRALGDGYGFSWRWDQAIASYGRAAQIAPGNPQVWLRLGRAQASASRISEALASVRSGLARSPSSPELSRLRAHLLLESGDPGAMLAERRWDRVRPPDFGPALRGRCDARVPGCRMLHAEVQRIPLVLRR